MKRYILLLLLTCSFVLNAQTQGVKVVLRNGATIIGQLKELEPTEYIILIVAGKESKIPMEDVETIENAVSNTSSNNIEISLAQSETNGFDTKEAGWYKITDHAQYPESFELEIEDQKIKMLLVRGGTFNMGYDGGGSLRMKSEPIHKVNLSSFYVSCECINEREANILLGKEKGSYSYKERIYKGKWKNAQKAVDNYAKKSLKPYRLLTEAEWEYAALMPFAEEFFGKEEYFEWCSDYFEKYKSGIQTNPKGPSSGREHVYRSFRKGNNKWDRKSSGIEYENIKASFRLAISADAIK